IMMDKAVHICKRIKQQISAMLSSMEKERITTQFCSAVFHGVLNHHSGTQEGAYHNTILQCCLPWSWTTRAAHRKECIIINFCNAVFHGEGVYQDKFLQCCLPWNLGPAQWHTGRSVSQQIFNALFHGVFVQRAAHRRSVSHQISAMLSSMESWTCRAIHRKERITKNFCNAVFHGVWDQQRVTLEYDSYPPPFSILHSPSWYYTITSGHLEHTSWWHFLLDPLKWGIHYMTM
ncbi:hypothetical protein J6590_103212, partial [Homalodisca vitripennis]